MKKAFKVYLKRKSGEDSREIVWQFQKMFKPELCVSAPYTKKVLADFMCEVFHNCDGFTFPILIITDEEDNIREIYYTYIDYTEEDGNVTGIMNWTDHTKYWDDKEEYDYFKGV